MNLKEVSRCLEILEVAWVMDESNQCPNCKQAVPLTDQQTLALRQRLLETEWPFWFSHKRKIDDLVKIMNEFHTGDAR